jgi:hypothetical protein
MQQSAIETMVRTCYYPADSADNLAWYWDTFKEISRNESQYELAYVPQAVQALKDAGLQVQKKGGAKLRIIGISWTRD